MRLKELEKMSEFLFRVGDEFQGNPSQMNKFMHMIFRAGGRVKIDGDRAIIVYLPPVVEAPVVEEPVVEEPVVEEVPVAPKRRRKTAAISQEEFIGE